MITIHKELQRCKQSGLRGVIGTIISTEGSTYQKTGAKCFIAEDGNVTGLLSGGCVEGDIKEYVHEVLASGLPTIVHYDFQDDGDIIWGLGLGCNGKMEIFLEPYRPCEDEGRAAIIDSYFSSALMKPLHSITIVESNEKSLLGTKWIIDPADKEFSKILYEEVVHDYIRQCNTFKNGLSYIGGELDLHVFYESTTPSPHLVIYGAGPDAVPLVRIAKTLNWHVSVLDYRPAYANQENFPDSDQLIVYPSGKVPDIEINKNSYVILMTHNFLQDQIILEGILETESAYIGLLGPRKRTDELIDTSKSLAGNSKLHHIHSPIGLDIGSQTPEEIALSILAEIMVAYRGGTGSRLSEVKGQRLEKECDVLLKT
ncbi:XdhC/CoxI family protein [Peribacillus cavernae]|uniref:XdhC/CoxI family protein n=1 Tax=Peribacillus cavernae TaxID=1674310 RepID=A0A3S0W9V0_9BACI|nr:XdhC/CoxI family protein [Peribacillus cavernae]MDQ0218702.1 xanthine/CO dehydrogenase XdhC/CoxF family maturation factor [Peribacillus cavernae]RUQ30919.1 XdhC/CoxI family protein [Peribacillus cavernae]